MTHADHILIGLMVGAASILWKIASEGVAQMQTLRASRNEIQQAIHVTNTEKAEIEEETGLVRDALDSAAKDLETLKARQDELIHSRFQ